jgi:hypothetical protein
MRVWDFTVALAGLQLATLLDLSLYVFPYSILS